MADRRVTYEEFVNSLKITETSSDSVAVSMKMLERELTREDVESDDVVSPSRLSN